MNKKKIAFIANDMTIGGVEQALVKLSRVLDYEHYAYVLWLVNKEGPLLDELDPRMEVRELPHAADLRSLLCHGKIKLFCRGMVNRLMARAHTDSWRLNQWYTSLCGGCLPGEYECVIAYHGTTSAVVANALYSTNARKRILWVHGDHRIASEEMFFFQKQYGRFDRIYCVSNAVRCEFINIIPGAARKAEVLHNIVDCDEIRRKAEMPLEIVLQSPSLVTVGRLAKEKGQQYIPQIVRLLLDRGYDIYWYLVGDGPLKEDLIAEIAASGAEKHIFLLGAQQNPYPYMKNCDIYVQPSLSEGWGITVQEARILHKPIVTTPLPVMAEQLDDGVNGCISKAATPDAMADSIERLLSHSALCQSYIENLKKSKSDYYAEMKTLYEFFENDM